jgi:putative transposase
MARVPASERTRNALNDMFAGKTVADKSSLVRQAARLIVEEALEKEAVDALGSGYYEHVADRRGYRNGYRTSRVKSAEGAIEFAVPQLADMAQPFRSKIREVIRGRTEELERLAVEMYARGLSVRDIEAAFTLRRLCRAPAASDLASARDAHYQHAGATLRRRAPANQGHSARFWRASRAQAHVRCAHPRERDLEEHRDHAIRAQAARAASRAPE